MIKITTRGLKRRLYEFINHWGLLILVGVLIASFWACMAVWMKDQQAKIIDANQRELVQLNLAVTQQAEALFKSVEIALQTLDLWLQANPGINPLTDPQFVALVDKLRRNSDGLVDPRFVTDDGKLFYVPTLDGKFVADVSDRAYFRKQMDDMTKRDLYIADPVQSRVTRKWGIPISWRLDRPISGLRVIFVNIELDRLSVVHEQLRKKPNGTITLIRLDGTILSRTPFAAKLVGENLSNTSNFKAEFGANASGSFLAERSTTDGVIRLISYNRLKNYPIILLVTEGYDDALAGWRAQRHELLVASLVMTILIVLAALILHKTMRAADIAQNEMHMLATTDSLTGVMNRRMFLDLAQREFSRAWRYGRPMGMLALDIDYFKTVNDNYGHATGDIVLRDCAAAWRAKLREQDLFGRIGGEEFSVVLPETTPDTTRQVAERLRAAVLDLKFSGAAANLSVTVSIGMTSLSRADEQLAQIMERADRALYLAKEHGRNRVESLDNKPPVTAGEKVT